MKAAKKNNSESIGENYIFGKRYAWYALGLLTTVITFSMIDRMIVTILAGEIKRNFSLGDSELGLLYGTLFAIFYALFGIPLGRLSDTWIRTRLIAIGLAGWSLMSMLSGLAATTWQFAFTRIGVGIGEASAGPAATSLLSDYFPSRLRATALALFSCGISIGIGASMWLGGIIVETWNGWYLDGDFPFGLEGWRIAFVTVSLPGPLLALLIFRLKEPPRGIADGAVQTASQRPFHESWQDLKAVIPVVSFVFMINLRVPKLALILNLAVLLGLCLLASLAIDFCSGLLEAGKVVVVADLGWAVITSHTIQWSVVALGLYCLFTWSQILERRDSASYRLICRTRATVGIIVGGSFNMIISYGVMGWAPMFAVTQYDESIATIGLKFGAVAALAGLLGTALGGYLADKLQRVTPRGRLYVSLAAMILIVPTAMFTLSRQNLNTYLMSFCLLGITSTASLSGVLSTLQDLVLPRMRGLVYATYSLGMTIIGLGTGPYIVGLISDITGSLKTGMLSLYFIAPLIWLCMGLAVHDVHNAHQTRFERAESSRKSGEIGDKGEQVLTS